MAGRIPEEFISEVRNNVNIVDVISQYVSLEKKGKDYVGLCPFHQEKTPSFTVNEEKQFFKCFGCGKGGNVFKFMMYKDNLTFPESVEEIANFAHIEMPYSYGHEEASSGISPLLKIHQLACNFYHHVLLSTKVGERGMAYAKSRQLSPELLEHFQIGYAPKANNLLLTYLRDQDFSEEDLVKSGLFVKSRDGQLFDRFRDRLMFPLGDESGKVIGFSGRKLIKDNDEPKYLNSPETEIFTKSKALFHFAEAKKAARSEGHLVLYEGFMDVISAYKAGIKSGIASMGTSLTEQQIYMLKRITRNIIINYDGDDPGIHAEERAVKLFDQAGGFNLGIVMLPEKLDPDEYVKKYGPEKYQNEIKGALSKTDFLLKRLAQKYNLKNDREKIAYINEAVKQIAQLYNPVEQDLYLDKLAKDQDISKDSLKVSLLRERRRLSRARRNTGQFNQPYQAEKPVQIEIENTKKEYDPAQTRLLYLFIKSEKARDYILESKFLFPDPEYAQLAELWLKFAQTHDDISINNFLDFVPEQLQGIIVNAEMCEMPQSFSLREIREIISSLAHRDINKQLEQLKRQIQDAERRSDNAEILKLTQQILELKRIKR